jgi:RHS repeat-associated protein
VLLDGTVIDTVTPSGASYADYTTPSFTVTAGSHTIEFQGLDTAGGDNTTFIDDVRFKAAVVSGSYRTSYDAMYFDDAQRETSEEDVGTNGGSAWTRPSTPDASDATHLVTSTTYGPQGLASLSIDPRGVQDLTVYNMLGQTTETIAAYTGTSASDMDANADVTDATPTDDTNQTTDITFDGNGDETSQTAVMPSGTPNQTTAWVYGVTTTAGSTLDSNDLLAKEEFPDATTGDASTSASDGISYTYDNLGETIGSTDQNGTTQAIGLDVLGRPISDSITTLGSGVDGTVRLITTAYDTQGDAYLMTSYGSTLGGTVLNQVEDVFNGLGQMTGQYQANSGAVTTSGPTPTPETQYTYSDPTNGSLMTAMTYPNGRILDYGYDDNALDTAIGRVDYLADAGGSDSGHLVDYLYMGLSTMVQQADANGVELTYLQQSGDSDAITSGPQYAGDEVTGLGTFGQVIDQNWVNTTTPTPTTTDRFQYNYDQDGNVLYSDNLVNSSESELYHSNSTASGDDNTAYDPLERLTAFARGTLSASSNNDGVLDTVSSPSQTQEFALDAIGNQTAVTTDGTTVDNTANSKNELTANGSNDLAFDDNGNTLTDQAGNTYTYTSWGQIATVKNSSGTTIATYTYAANGNRITETASGTTTGFYYNGPQIIEQRQGSTVTSQNVFNIDYVNDLLLGDDNSTSGNLGISGSGLGQRLFAQHDTNSDVTALTNTSGVVQERFVYSPYGTVTVLSPSWSSTTDSFGWGYLFQGMWQDPVTGLYYTPNRDYSAALGRWMEQDPAGPWFDHSNAGNAYAFAGSAPICRRDATGLLTWFNEPTQIIIQASLSIPNRRLPDGIPWAPTSPNTLAGTVARLNLRSSFAHPASCGWHLADDTVEFWNEIYRLSDAAYLATGVDPAWVLRAENDHVNDYSNWSRNIGRPLASRLEAAEKPKSFPTLGAAEADVRENLASPLRDSLIAEALRTVAARDDTGQHMYQGPNHRP